MRLFASFLCAIAVAFSSAARAQTQDLSVARAGNTLEVFACPQAPCPAGTPTARVTLPEDVTAAPQTEWLRIGRRNVMVLTAPRPKGRWVGVFSADRTKRVLEVHLKGTVDAVKPSGKVRRLIVRPEARELLLGAEHQGADLCGRKTLLDVRRLDGDSWEWVALGASGLTERARSSAVETKPTPVEATRHLPVFKARLASSARDRKLNGATDGDIETTWTPRRTRSGEEFLILDAPRELPVRGADLTMPRAAEASPQAVLLVTESTVYRVPTAKVAAGSTVRVSFEKEARCVGVVLEPKPDAPRVAIAEVGAVTPFAGRTIDDLVQALDGAEAGPAEALLRRGGPRATEALIRAYPRLGIAGEERAKSIIVAGDCRTQAPFFTEMILGRFSIGKARFDPATSRKAAEARDRLRRCPEAGADRLAEAMRGAGVSQSRVWAARELADLAPGVAIEAILAVLSEGSTAPEASGQRDGVRRGLRAALAVAARDEKSRDALEKRLAPAAYRALSLVEQIDLLRAIGKRLPALKHGPAAFETTSRQPSFRTRYLLVPPAAHLARAGSATAQRWLGTQLKSATSPHLRIRAAEEGLPQLRTALVATMDDPHPRVRAAAIRGLQLGREGAPTVKLTRLLQRDPWTMVRVAVANALGDKPLSPESDAALLEAASEDRSILVRTTAIRAIGRRGQVGAAGTILDTADNPKLTVAIRVSAIEALADLCHADSLGFLTKLARRTATARLPYDQPLGLAALRALGRLFPGDIDDRVAPLLNVNADVPRAVQQLARAARRGDLRTCAPSPRTTAAGPTSIAHLTREPTR